MPAGAAGCQPTNMSVEKQLFDEQTNYSTLMQQTLNCPGDMQLFINTKTGPCTQSLIQVWEEEEEESTQGLTKTTQNCAEIKLDQST